MTELVETVMRALQEQAARQRGFLSDALAKALAQVAIDTIRESASGGAAASGLELAPADEGSWRTTGELRWYTEQIDTPVQLQQAWRRVEDGLLEWRPVPLVIEGRARAGGAV